MTSLAAALDLRPAPSGPAATCGGDRIGLATVPSTQTHRWTARLVAQRVTDQAQWLPSGAVQQQLAASGVKIRCDRAHYELRFELAAPDLNLATRAVMARWARLCEVYAVPDWPLMAMNITHIDDQPNHAESRAPDTSRPVSPAGLTPTSRYSWADRSAPDRMLDDRKDAALLVGGRA